MEKKFKFEITQGGRDGTANDPFVLGGLGFRITEIPEGINHLFLGQMRWNGVVVPYQHFGFEMKMGIHVGSTASLGYIDRNHMGEIGLLTFTCSPYVNGLLRRDLAWTASAILKYQYRDGSTKLKPRKFKETLLNTTLDALYEAETEEIEEMYVFEVDHSNRKRKNVKIRGQFTQAGYPEKFVVPGKLYEAMVREGLIKKMPLEWAPGEATAKAKTTRLWGRHSDYLNYNWVDWVQLVRDGKLVGYAWHPFGKLQIMSERNAQRLVDSASVWDRLLGLIWDGRKPGQ